MKPTLKTSTAGRRLIKSFEGFRSKAAALPGGGWVIGYGHTRSAREGVAISEDDADKLLIYDLLPVEAAINEHVAVPLSQNQFDALASLTLNIGRDNFLNSTVLQRLNENRPLEAALAFDQWRATMVDGKAVVVDTLLRRRAAERALFLTPPDGPMAAPSPELAPVADARAQGLSAPLMNYRADLSGVTGGRFEVSAAARGPTPAIAEDESEAEDEAVAESRPEPEFEVQFEPESSPEPMVELEVELEAETEAGPASDFGPEPEPEDEEQAEIELAPVGLVDDQADEPEEGDEASFLEPAAGDEIAFEPESAEAEPFEPEFESEPEPAETEWPQQEPELIPVEAALEEDEPVEEVFVATGDEEEDLPAEAWDEQDGDEPPADMVRPVEPEPQPQQGMSWAELARQRARLRGAAGEPAPAAEPVARREDLLVRKAEAEWSLDEETEYSPDRDWGAGWYALFLAIGVALAAFGAWDTWQRATGAVDEAFVYGPAIAAAGVLFMAIAGWFLVKRVLAFR